MGTFSGVFFRLLASDRRAARSSSRDVGLSGSATSLQPEKKELCKIKYHTMPVTLARRARCGTSCCTRQACPGLPARVAPAAGAVAAVCAQLVRRQLSELPPRPVAIVAPQRTESLVSAVLVAPGVPLTAEPPAHFRDVYWAA